MRCEEEVFDGWEDTTRCLLDVDHKEPHNYNCPGTNPKLIERYMERKP